MEFIVSMMGDITRIFCDSTCKHVWDKMRRNLQPPSTFLNSSISILTGSPLMPCLLHPRNPEWSTNDLLLRIPWLNVAPDACIYKRNARTIRLEAWSSGQADGNIIYFSNVLISFRNNGDWPHCFFCSSLCPIGWNSLRYWHQRYLESELPLPLDRMTWKSSRIQVVSPSSKLIACMADETEKYIKVRYGFCTIYAALYSFFFSKLKMRLQLLVSLWRRVSNFFLPVLELLRIVILGVASHIPPGTSTKGQLSLFGIECLRCFVDTCPEVQGIGSPRRTMWC